MMRCTVHLLLAAAFLSTSPCSAQPSKKPNVIFVLVDDMGYGADCWPHGKRTSIACRRNFR